jgi:hypothetical protein
MIAFSHPVGRREFSRVRHFGDGAPHERTKECSFLKKEPKNFLLIGVRGPFRSGSRERRRKSFGSFFKKEHFLLLSKTHR